MLKIIRHHLDCSPSLLPANINSVVTIGNFDGMHLGHQALLSQCCERAQHMGLVSVVILFEPQPREYFNREGSPARLMRFREKIEFLKKYPVNYVYVLRFNKQIAKLPAGKFIQDILVGHLKTRVLLVGEDFHFGHQREGDITLLQKSGTTFGFEVTLAPTVALHGQKISSTLVREILAAGNVMKAATFLGHPFWLSGHVCYGLGLGRQINCPTLNIALCRQFSPLFGIYVVYVKNRDGKIFPGVACVGVRPTLGHHQPLLEVHLLDVNVDMYGQFVHVFFLKKLRDEEKFSSLAALKTAMQNDIARSRDFFRESTHQGDFLEFVKRL